MSLILLVLLLMEFSPASLSSSCVLMHEECVLRVRPGSLGVICVLILPHLIAEYFSSSLLNQRRSTVWINTAMKSEFCGLSGAACVCVRECELCLVACTIWIQMRVISQGSREKCKQGWKKEVKEKKKRGSEDERERRGNGAGDSILQLPTSRSSPDILMKWWELVLVPAPLFGCLIICQKLLLRQQQNKICTHTHKQRV